jgi:hypothetical protein
MFLNLIFSISHSKALKILKISRKMCVTATPSKLLSRKKHAHAMVRGRRKRTLLPKKKFIHKIAESVKGEKQKKEERGERKMRHPSKQKCVSSTYTCSGDRSSLTCDFSCVLTNRSL